jgi:hypothetical protein
MEQLRKEDDILRMLGYCAPDFVHFCAGIDSCTQTNAWDHRGRPIRFRKDFDRVRCLLDEVRRAEESF